MGYGRGWATGTDVRSRPYTHIAQADWDRIFKKARELNNCKAPPPKTWNEIHGNRSKDK